MSPSRFRFVWPALCGLLVAGLAVSTVHWKKQLRVATENAKKKAKQPKQPPFDKRDAAFFRELAALRSYQKLPLGGEDAAKLAAYDRIELNKQWALGRDTQPHTVATRDQPLTELATLPLTAEMKLPLATTPALYRYELTNVSDSSRLAPVVYARDRWDTPAAMVETAGFKAITDETERAIAIWRYVCPRRVFGDPPTEGTEEHDVLKFLACYGYGFCDDSARAVAALAELSGMKSRVWELDGHVVAEIMAGGEWRMFDADQQAYFHRADAPKEILGVEDLAGGGQAAFEHMVSFRDAKEYNPKYRDCFLSRDNNKVSTGGTSASTLETTLRPGEKMAFTNFNWGRYFLGKFPTPPPRYYNGTFTYPVRANDFTKASNGVIAEAMEKGVRLRNSGGEAGSITLVCSYPFPIVGGLIAGTPRLVKGSGQLRVEDADHGREFLEPIRDRIHFDLDHFVAVLTSNPTNTFTISFSLSPGTELELTDFVVQSDFQFAQAALLPLTAGENLFHAFLPEKVKAEDFKLTVSSSPP